MPATHQEYEDKPRAQQRAARVTYHLLIRAITGLPGLTTVEIAKMLKMTRQGALVMMNNISGPGGVPVCQIEARWVIVVHPPSKYLPSPI